jgi:hypothetical protein
MKNILLFAVLWVIFPSWIQIQRPIESGSGTLFVLYAEINTQTTMLKKNFYDSFLEVMHGKFGCKTEQILKYRLVCEVCGTASEHWFHTRQHQV